MATIRDFADAVIRMEGSMSDPRSVNQRMVREYGLWNVGHISWAHQPGAVPVNIGGRLWAGWPTYEAAYEGLLRQLRKDISRGFTLEQFTEKYAPKKDGNNPEQYARNVSIWAGIPLGVPLKNVVTEAGPSPLIYASVEKPSASDGGDIWARLAELYYGDENGDGDGQQAAAITGGVAVLIAAAAVGTFLLLRR
jgi:hypothetical protein